MCQAERGGEDNVILMQGPLIFYNSSIDSMFLHCIKPQSSSSSASCKVWHDISYAQFFHKPSFHLYVVTYDKPASISRGQQVYAKKSTKRIQAWDKHSIMNNNIFKSKASELLEWFATIMNNNIFKSKGSELLEWFASMLIPNSRYINLHQAIKSN